MWDRNHWGFTIDGHIGWHWCIFFLFNDEILRKLFNPVPKDKNSNKYSTVLINNEQVKCKYLLITCVRWIVLFYLLDNKWVRYLTLVFMYENVNFEVLRETKPFEKYKI